MDELLDADDLAWLGENDQHDEFELDLSEDQWAEFDRTFGDQIWRLQNLYKVQVKPTKDNPRGGIRPFNLWGPQLSMYHNMWHRNLVLKARQLGSSTFWCMFILDSCLFNQDPVRAGIISYTLGEAEELLDKCRLAFEEMDEDVKVMFGWKMKASKKKLIFSNKSTIRAGISLRGGTTDILLVSELGKMAARFAQKASEVITGALQTVPQEGAIVAIESTAEGTGGAFFDMVEEAGEILDNPTRLLGNEDYHLHFFAWHEQREYRSSDPYDLTDADKLYFDRLRMRGILFDKEQQWWYARKHAALGEEIYREFPSYRSEAFMASSRALILAKLMIDAEEKGQIGGLAPRPDLPVCCSWDLGVTSAVWFYQYLSPSHRCYIDYIECQHADFKLWKIELDRLAAERGYRYGQHIFPFDGGQVMGMANTMKAFAEAEGITNIHVLPHHVPFEIQLRYAAAMMPTSYFDLDRTMLGRQRMLSYRRRFDQVLGDFIEKAHKGIPSHGSEAWILSLFYDPSGLTMPPPPPPTKTQRKQIKKPGLLKRLFGKPEKRPVSVMSADGAMVIGNSLLSRLLKKK